MNYLEVHRSTQDKAVFKSITFKDACQVFYVQSGSMKVTISGEEHLLQTGDSAYVPPGAPFTVEPARQFAR
jgi:mannose-6-phosphate isomerase-like protein (cupin superfamily)